MIRTPARVTRDELSDKAISIAAKATGLRPDQIARAVAEYRAATDDLHQEPEWAAVVHMSGPDIGLAQYGSADTKVTLQIETERVRGKSQETWVYVFAGKPYETYSEAREVELQQETRPKLYDVGTS